MRWIYFAVLMLSLASGVKAQACFPGTECENAPFFCGYVLENNNFVNIVPGLHTSTPPSCIGTLHNSNWFRIVPCDVNLSLMIQIENCNGLEGLQAALFDDCGSDANLLGCYAGGSGATTFVLDAIVEPGRPYFLQIDGENGDICEYGISVLSGLDVSPPLSSPVNGTITGAAGGYCNGSESFPVTFTASWPGCDGPLDCYTPSLDSCNGIRWTLPPGSLIIGSPYANPVTVSFQNVLSGTYLIRAAPRICPDVVCQQCYCPAMELSFQITIGGSCNQDCEAFNDPAPPGDGCSEAPFLCGNYLDGYCSSNAGLGNDTLAGTVLHNSGFLRFSPCEDSLHLRLRVRDCAQGNNLIFRLMGGSCEDPEFIGTVVVPNGVATDFIFPVTVPDDTYFLVFDGGPSGNICEFYVEVVGGIGTVDPGGTFTCDCTGGNVVGPTDLCPADIAVYSLTPLDCSFTFTPDGGGFSIGNGYSCCPDTSTLDSFQLVWHIPDAMNFLSDSVNVNTITVQVDSSLLGIDTMITGVIWVSFEPVFQTPVPGDSLVYCDCPAMNCPIDGGSSLTVHISHEVEQEVCYLTCSRPVCYFETSDGRILSFNQPGTYFEQTNCETLTFLIFNFQYPPDLFIPPVLPLNCNNPVRTLVAQVSSLASSYFWTGPGIISSPNAASISVNAPGTYFCTIFDAFTGCPNMKSVVVTADFTPPIAVANPNTEICQGESTLLSAAGSSTGGNFSYTWSNGQPGQSISVSPASTTVYTLTVRNTTNGCVSTASTTVVVNPPDTLDHGVVGTITCLETCVAFLGNEYCSPGIYLVQTDPCLVQRFEIIEDTTLPVTNLIAEICAGECFSPFGTAISFCQSGTYQFEFECILYLLHLTVNEVVTIDLGVVGTITCSQPCVNYLGSEYCTAGVYFIESGPCEISRFTIGENLTLPTVTLPVVTLCEGECHTFYGQEYCTSTTVSVEDNCTNYVQQIIVNPPDTIEMGVVGTITCLQPCVNYLGVDYCTSGMYTIESGPCEISRFTIGENLTLPTVTLPVVTLCEGECHTFYGQEYCTSTTVSVEDNCTNYVQQIIVNPPDTIEMGVVGTITCLQPCVNYLGLDYCTSGMYTIESGPCEISRFTIGENLTLPTVTLPVVTLCEGECHTFYGQEYCTSTTVSVEDNCTNYVQQIIVNLPDTIELGVVGTITCLQPCVNYFGIDYCTSGVYTMESGPCEISRFTIGENLTLPTVTLPVVTLCEGECHTFYGQEYCTSTTVSVEDNCTNYVQQIIVNPLTVFDAGLVGNLSCGAPCVDFQGVEYCVQGHYADTTACLITLFEIGFVRDTQQLGQIGTLSCQQPCVSFLQDLYCVSGNYTVEDDCTVYHFSIAGNQSAPGYGNPNLQCLPNNYQYTVGFAITGTPPYKVNGEAIAGTYYTSPPIANGVPYAFVIEQVNNGCQTVVSGSYDCSFMCTGNPGTMRTERLDVCIGTAVQVVPADPPQPGPGQVVRFLLHTLPGTTPGTILAENETGLFSFDPATMVPEETYYLSCAIGTLSPGGVLDFSNFCTRIAPGQPVVFHAPPLFMDILRENPSCFGELDGSLKILSSGTAPVDYAINGEDFGSQSLFGGLGAGTYDLALRDASGCVAHNTATLTEPDSLWLDLGPDQEITRGQALLLQATCNLDNPSPVWSNDQDATTQEGIEWLVRPVRTTLYTCEVQDENGCVAEASLLVQVRSNGVFHPNVLYRESDNPANRYFTLFAQEGHVQQINSLKIFDRWGGLVFQRTLFAPNIPELGWDGTIGNTPANSAVFVFVAELLLSDGTVEVVKGDVTVL